MNNKYVWIAVALVVLLVILGFTRKAGYLPQESPSSSPTASQPASAPKSGAAVSGTQAYSKLVEQYAGKRVEFDITCQARPNNLSVASGTSVMFDNRSGDARTIKVGTTSYYFAGYGYKILKLTSPTLPKTLLLSCGSAVNVGQIQLQQ